MNKYFPDPDIGAKGTSSHVTSATEFTGIAQNLEQANEDLGDLYDIMDKPHDPHLEKHLTDDMQKRKKNHQL